jgi:hypothetical protein
MPELVIAERDYYDGPRSGIALFRGVPHRFCTELDEIPEELSDVFLLWPIDEADLQLEIEQWNIFVAWNDRYEAGTASTDTHPGSGGIDSRWDAIEDQLRGSRVAPRGDVVRALATFVRLDREKRYASSGPDYGVDWQVLSGAV